MFGYNSTLVDRICIPYVNKYIDVCIPKILPGKRGSLDDIKILDLRISLQNKLLFIFANITRFDPFISKKHFVFNYFKYSDI